MNNFTSYANLDELFRYTNILEQYPMLQGFINQKISRCEEELDDLVEERVGSLGDQVFDLEYELEEAEDEIKSLTDELQEIRNTLRSYLDMNKEGTLEELQELIINEILVT